MLPRSWIIITTVYHFYLENVVNTLECLLSQSRIQVGWDWSVRFVLLIPYFSFSLILKEHFI